MNKEVEQVKSKVISYYQDFIDKCIDVNGIDLNTIINDSVTAGFEAGYNSAISDAADCLDDYELVYSDSYDYSAGVESRKNEGKKDILDLKKPTR